MIKQVRIFNTTFNHHDSIEDDNMVASKIVLPHYNHTADEGIYYLDADEAERAKRYTRCLHDIDRLKLDIDGNWYEYDIGDLEEFIQEQARFVLTGLGV